MSIRFGTDGWRAVIGDEFTFANVRHVAKAIAGYLNEMRDASNAPVVVGFDTRFLSDRYALEVSRVLADEGLSVFTSKSDCPTPAMAYAIAHLGALGGVMVTASHNPPRYNGLKFKGYHGGPGLDSETRRIEEILGRNLASGVAPAENDWALSSHIDRGYPGVQRFDPLPAYLEHVRSLLDLDAISRCGLRVAIDPMFGAGRGYAAAFLREAGYEVTEIHGELNPGFGGLHPEPIGRNLQDLIRTVRTGHYDLGLATDGDADRIGAVDAEGNFVDPHRIFSLVLHHLVEQRKQRGAVVKTVSTTQLLNRLARHYGLPIHETPVGFNHICGLMLTEDVLIGGEESGGITIRGHVPDGDGVLMSLLLVELLSYRRQSLQESIADLMHQFGEFRYGRNDVHTRAFDKKELTDRLMAEAPGDILGHSVTQVSGADGVKYTMDDDSWLLIRPSGTEPVLRIYAEATSDDRVSQLLAAGASLAHL